MALFLALLGVWLALPSLTAWLLRDGSALLACAVPLALLLLLPLALQLFIAHKAVFPPWYHPGSVPAPDGSAREQQAGGSQHDRKHHHQQQQHQQHLSHATAKRVEQHASASSSQSASELRSFESAFESADDAGTLGRIVGAAVLDYAGRITNPLIDFGLPFSNVTIRCTDAWRRKGGDARSVGGVTAAATAATVDAARRKSGTAAAPPKRKHSDPAAADVDGADADVSSSLLARVAAPPSVLPSYALRAWYVEAARPSDTIVLLVHGAARDRRTFMRHVPVFHHAGYSTLLLDCREHGTSSAVGLGVGFTTREAFDVIHAARFARQALGYTRVVVCGTSQGGASAIVASVLGEEIEPMEESHAQRAQSYRHARAHGATSPSSATPSPLSPASPAALAATASASHYLFDGVIAENPFRTRERCLYDVLDRLLGHLPALTPPPVRWAKEAFIFATLLVFRWKLGLLRMCAGGVGGLQWNCARVKKGIEGMRDASAAVKNSGDLPSAAHRPLPPLLDSAAVFPLSAVQAAASQALQRDPRALSALLRELNALDVVSRIAPRPLLLMHGLEDAIVQPVHAEALFAQARAPKKLWLLEGAHHTALINTDPQGWKDTVLGFLRQHGL